MGNFAIKTRREPLTHLQGRQRCSKYVEIITVNHTYIQFKTSVGHRPMSKPDDITRIHVKNSSMKRSHRWFTCNSSLWRHVCDMLRLLLKSPRLCYMLMCAKLVIPKLRRTRLNIMGLGCVTLKDCLCSFGDISMHCSYRPNKTKSVVFIVQLTFKFVLYYMGDIRATETYVSIPSIYANKYNTKS